MATDCKSVGLRPTGVQIPLPAFQMRNAECEVWNENSAFCISPSTLKGLCSSVVEHFIGNEEVAGPIPAKGCGK